MHSDPRSARCSTCSLPGFFFVYELGDPRSLYFVSDLSGLAYFPPFQLFGGLSFESVWSFGQSQFFSKFYVLLVNDSIWFNAKTNL